jgi:hypothetical protein
MEKCYKDVLIYSVQLDWRIVYKDFQHPYYSFSFYRYTKNILANYPKFTSVKSIVTDNKPVEFIPKGRLDSIRLFEDFVACFRNNLGPALLQPGADRFLSFKGNDLVRSGAHHQNRDGDLLAKPGCGQNIYGRKRR